MHVLQPIIFTVELNLQENGRWGCVVRASYNVYIKDKLFPFAEI